MPFGQIVIGPPGSGKSTYCNGMHQFLTALGRKPVIVNLDFANDNLPYPCEIDVKSLITVDQVMKEHNLGPNGALLYCMDFLVSRFEWLIEALESQDQESYFLFDCPGQVELFVCDNAFQKVLLKLSKLHHRLTAVHLVDSFHCIDPSKFISILLLSLQTMLQLELPHINLLTKLDILDSFGELPLKIEEICQPLDLDHLLRLLEDSKFGQKYAKLSKALCELIEDYGLISFIPVAVEDKTCMAYALQEIDKANGFIFGGLTMGNESIMEAAMSEQNSEDYFSKIKDKYFTFE